MHTYLIKINAINPLSAISDRITAIEPYIQHLSNSLNSLSDEENRTIKGVLGQGADTFWLRSFQNIINKQFPEYAPEELVEWKETQDQSLQQEGADRKKDIRKQLRILLFDRLEMVFGAKWLNNVAILKNAVEGRIIKEYGDSDDFDMSEYDWRDYLEISEYRDRFSRLRGMARQYTQFYLLGLTARVLSDPGRFMGSDREEASGLADLVYNLCGSQFCLDLL